MKATALVSIYGICVTAVLMFYAVYEWLAPPIPMIIGGVAVLLPAVVMVYFLEEDARPPEVDVMMWVKTMLLAAIFGIALPAMWTGGKARAKALQLLPSVRSAELATADPHPAVQDAACQLMFSGELKVLPGQIADIMSRNPLAATSCLANAGSGPVVGEVTKQLALSWHDALMDGGAAQCEYASAIDALPMLPPNRVGFLLDCALRGTGEARACCADQLAAAYPGKDLDKQIQKAGPILTQLGSSAFLLAAAFDERAYVAKIAPTAKQLRLQTDAMKQSSLDLACTAVVEEAGRPDDMRYLEWLFDQNTACLENKEGTTDVIAACRLILEQSSQERKDVGRALCAANEDARKQKLAAAAAFKTGVAFGDDADEIDKGRASLQADRTALENFEELAKSGEVANLSDEERMALIANFRGSAFGKEDPVGLTPEQLKAQGASLKTKDGADEFKASHEKSLTEDHGDAERVLGISVQELRDSIDEDGEVSPEMQEKIDAAEKKHKQ